ncbi:hypothetical protein GCM10010277_81020 [Streptomyces longisporoflavus]|nr:hypothetical protein GCM10010277_81020 [Streptomyces longisporoflavus]
MRHPHPGTAERGVAALAGTRGRADIDVWEPKQEGKASRPASMPVAARMKRSSLSDGDRIVVATAQRALVAADGLMR